MNNLNDYNFNTAWVEGAIGDGIGEFVEYEFPENFDYASPYSFHGECIIFNGYCKTYKTWSENSRVKQLQAYFNDEPICMIELNDIWLEQSFDISKFFINKRGQKFLNASFEIKEGDKLKFEIVDIYQGKKYQDVAITEFLCVGSSN